MRDLKNQKTLKTKTHRLNGKHCGICNLFEKIIMYKNSSFFLYPGNVNANFSPFIFYI
jgi:hypothetical protein